MSEIKNEAQKYHSFMKECQQYLHAHPELLFDLDNTITFIKNKLVELGYSPIEIGNHGVVASIGKGSPCILLRADMDALPLKEQTSLSYASTNDNSHACGHDYHMAMLLGAAAILKNHTFKGQIKLLFQPAEENASGAKNMVEAGVLNDVDYAFGMHIKADQPLGTIHYRSGVFMPSSDFFTITVKGKSTHGSAPHNGIDALSIASHIIVNLEMINAREIDASERFVITFGSMQAGTTGNIIPDKAIIKGSIRCFDKNVREKVLERFKTIINSTATMFRGSAEVDIPMTALTLENSQYMVDTLTDSFKTIAEVDAQTEPLSISEDFSYYAKEVPSLFVMLGAQRPDYPPLPLHSPNIIFDQDALVYGAATYVLAALTILK